MKSTRRPFVAVLTSLFVASLASAQAPTLNHPFPLGGQRGTSIELTLTGKGLAGPTGVWNDFSAKVTIPADKNNGKEDAKLRVKLDIPKDAPVGPHGIRVATTRGVSNFRIFCVDDLPQVVETNSNRSSKTAQPVPVPSVVCGRADAEVRDYFSFDVAAGQALTFEVVGRRLGSGFDPQITLYDSEGRDLPGGYNNSSPGRLGDPCLRYTFSKAGKYIVSVRDISYRGGADFFYRLRIGDFPCATTPIPLAGNRGSEVALGFAGPHVDSLAPMKVRVPSDPSAEVFPVAPKWTHSAWPVYLTVSDMPEATEDKAQTKEKPQKVAIPSGMSGLFEKERDRDYYTFTAKKGETIQIEAHTQEHGSPAVVYMTLRDAKGKQLLATDPNKPTRFDFKPAADGDYTLVIEHQHYWGGPAQSYRLTFTKPTNGFSVTAKADRFSAPIGGKTYVPITVARTGYQGPIEFGVVGAPGINSKFTLPEKQTSGMIPVEIGDSVAVGPTTIRIVGKATVAGKPITRLATCTATIRGALGNIPSISPPLGEPLALGVTPKAPFTLTAKLDAAKTKLTKPVGITVTATREKGFESAIALRALSLPANVKVAIKPIAAKTNEIKITLTPAKNAPAGTHTIYLSGASKVGDQTLTTSVVPLTLVLVK